MLCKAFDVLTDRLTVPFYASSVCVGFSIIIKNLKDLVPPLINIFLEFIPSIHSMESLEGKSFACMASLLHSIDLIVRSIAYGTDKKSQSPSSQGGPDVADVSISSALLKKLFSLFPLNPTDHLSARVCVCF